MEKNIPFLDLKRGYFLRKKEIDAAIKKVIGHSSFILGEELILFEKEFAEFCKVNFCVGLSSGTQALELALLALDIKPDEEVITVPNSFVATAEAIINIKAKPVFVDLGPDYNLDPDKIEKAITKKTKALLPVHLYGRPCKMDQILEIAKKYRLKVVNDCCQAHGAEYKNKSIGQFGDISCFSFYPSKNLGAFGDGGCLITNNREIAKKVSLLRNHGESQNRYHHLIPGFCCRLDNLQAAVLRVKLKYLKESIDKRIAHARRYNELLKETSLILPPSTEDGKNAYHLYVIRHKKRDQLKIFLEEKGISSLIHYPLPIHLEEGYKFLNLKEGSFPQAEEYAKEILSLPLFPELENEEIEYIADKIKEFESKED